MSSNDPFSRRRWGTDLVTALPAVGLFLGALAGWLLGAVNPDGSAVAFAGIGMVVGVVLGVFLRVVFRRG